MFLVLFLFSRLILTYFTIPIVQPLIRSYRRNSYSTNTLCIAYGDLQMIHIYIYTSIRIPNLERRVYISLV